MSIKTALTQATLELKASPLLVRLRAADLSRDQFRIVLAQKFFLAKNFDAFISSVLSKAKVAGANDLAHALEKNLRDERGYGPDGRIHSELAHRTWRDTFYKSLGLTPARLKNIAPLPGTHWHADVMNRLQDRASTFVQAGAFLMLERFIPLEYRAFQKSRDTLFPELFVINPLDLEAVKNKKVLACQYVDDHITHDAQEHFPELLKALAPYESDEVKLKEILLGVDLIVQARRRFYAGLEQVFTLEKETA